MRIELTAKGQPASPDVAPNALLVEALRYRPQLTGVHVVDCDTLQRGVCTVLLAGRAVKSCNLPEGQETAARSPLLRGSTRPSVACRRLSVAARALQSRLHEWA